MRDDELDLLRAVDPVSSHEGPWRERPLDHRAERALNQLLFTTRRRKVRRRLVVRAEAAVLAIVAVLAYTFSGPGAQTAAAVPTALHLRTDAPSVSLDVLAHRAAARAKAAGPEDGPRRGSHLQSWYMSMESGPDAAPPVTVPEERITRWNADGGGSEMVVATDPRHPGRPVIHADGNGRWRTVNDGKVLHRKVYPAGSEAQHGGLASRTEPPTDPDDLRELLRMLYGSGTGDTPELLQALSSYRQEWTPGPRETAAVVELLASADGLRPAGIVTDRLGRRGQAYVYTGHDGSMAGSRQMIILDPLTGTLLGSEITFTKDVPDYKIKAGDVMSYEAWMP
ncbi:CU044_5270 family protein [Streptomyces sp. NPDC048644]|uniref:CU044_5270 family protein n=1 Tax=Streptomyces sp. NPDC048644 TaxID=3365582 RepID=UPI003710DB3F